MIRILIADDSGPVREALAALLTAGRDFEVVGAAADGEEAVEMAELLAPDVVVMDCRMPVMDGAEATRRIKSRDTSIGVVILSAYADQMEECIAASADAYLLKGCVHQEIFATIIAAASSASSTRSKAKRGGLGD